MMKKITICCVGLLPTIYLAAQEQVKDSTLNRTVVVENQYNPEVMDAFKVNVLPRIEEPAVTKQEINYATAPRPLSQWSVQPMQAFTPGEKQEKAPRGYIRAAYGSRNNADLKASYLWDMTSRDCLGVSASFYGMNGKIPYLQTQDEKWKSRFYRTDAQLDYRHDFRKASLEVGGSFASQVFNYMPSGEEHPDYTASTDRQRYTLGEGYAAVYSRGNDLPVEFFVRTGLRSFSRKHNALLPGNEKETAIHTEGLIAGAIDEEQRVGFGLVMDNLMYDVALTDYTLVQLNPYYELKNEDILLRAGAHVDWQVHNNSEIKVSPDVKFEYTFSDTYVVYLHALGGAKLNDFRRINSLSPYWAQSQQPVTTNTLLDASIGLKASPVNGLGLRLFGGYRITDDELFSLPGTADEGSNYVYNFVWQDDANVTYGGAGISYAFRDWIDFSLDGTYYNWDADNEALLLLKPEFAVNFSGKGKVFDGLYLTLDYAYEQRNKVADYGRAKAVNNLSVGAEYRLFDRMTVFAGLNNLLNKYYVTEAGYPVQGFYAMGGISFRF